ncbi:MAG: DUF4126 domain-containing protein [Anaerolineae bacterium]|nr:MAG: DUF4126 domain-containing protein [Anaerolineae bacterium]
MDIFTAFGLSASAGLNAYIPLLVVALMARFTDWVELRSPWDTLSNPWVIGVLVVLSLVEFFADKIPAVNHINDAIQTFVRPVAGAIVFAASTSLVDMSPVLAMAAGLLVAGTVHTAKAAAVRPMITATTGGAANTPVSILEDVISTALSILAVVIPVLIAALVILMLTTLIWWLWRRANRSQV